MHILIFIFLDRTSEDKICRTESVKWFFFLVRIINCVVVFICSDQFRRKQSKLNSQLTAALCNHTVRPIKSLYVLGFKTVRTDTR
jgi:hypothetical protein